MTECNAHAILLFVNENLLSTNFIYFESLSNLVHDIRNKAAPSKIQNLFTDVSEIHTYTTRSTISQNYQIHPSRTNLLKKSFSHFGAKVWNEIPQSIKKLPKKMFKKTIHTCKTSRTPLPRRHLHNQFPHFNRYSHYTKQMLKSKIENL